MNFKKGVFIALKRSFPIKENKITKAMLMKLFATSNVAKSFLGFSKRLTIIFPLELFS